MSLLPQSPKNLEGTSSILLLPELTLCVLEVMSPQWSDFILTAHIPHSKTDVFVFNGLHIETYKQGNIYVNVHQHRPIKLKI